MKPVTVSPASPLPAEKRLALPGGGPAIDFVLIPAGPFLMGDVAARSPEPDTRPVHEVELDAFYMARSPVTNEQFAWFVRQTGYRTTRERAGKRTDVWSRFAGQGKERHPVICVNWIDAAAFAVWARVRLPTEAEWEKAARGGLERADYPWGDEEPGDRCNWRHARYKPDVTPLNDDGWGITPVGSYPPNGYGLYDMSGNVWEWCADAYHPRYYDRSPRRNPLGPEADVNGLHSPVVRWQGGDHLRVPGNSFRVIRGGSWENNSFGLRCCERISASAGTHNKGTVGGFRVAASPEMLRP